MSYPRLFPFQVALWLAALAMSTISCAPRMFESANKSATSSSLCDSDCFGKPDSPYALMTSYQVFSSMLNVTEQNNAVSPTMRAEYDSRAGTLADNDNIASVTAPLQMATTSVAGEVCNSLLVREQALASANRKFFGQVDFTLSLAQNSATTYMRSLSSLAETFWGRSATEDELRLLRNFYDDFLATSGSVGSAAEQVRSTRKLYLSVCSAMLSSFDMMIH